MSGSTNETNNRNTAHRVSKAFNGNYSIDCNGRSSNQGSGAATQTKHPCEEKHITSALKEIIGKMLDETKRKILRIKANTESSKTGLRPLKNEYSAQYKRLTWIRNVTTKNGIASEELENSHNTVTIETVHQCPNNGSSTTVLLVGGPGEGKTTSALHYADRAIEKQISGPGLVYVIVFIQAKDIDWGGRCKPFDLLFKHQFANVFINGQITRCFEEWVAQNPSRVSVIIDGVDEIINYHSFAAAKMSLDKQAPPAAILLNIIRRDMYRGMWVACTVSPHWLWKFPIFDIDIPSVRIVGFREADVGDILTQLTRKRESVDQLMHRFPTIRNMCKTPAILMHLARQIQEHDSLSDVKILLDTLDFFDSHHAGIQTFDEKKMKYVMEVAYKSAERHRLELDVHESDQSMVQGMGHFISVSLHPQSGKFAGANVKPHQLLYQFNSEAMRDILAAFHWLSIPYTMDINLALQRALTNTNIARFMLLGVAILANRDHWRMVNSFSKTSVYTLEKYQRGLESFLDYVNNKSSTISDANTIRILSQCTRLLSGSTLAKVRMIRMKSDCEAVEVLSIAKSIPPLTKFKAERSMSISASSLHLLETRFALKASTLKIKGDMQNGAQYLSKLLAACTFSGKRAFSKFKIEYVEFIDYDMNYCVKDNVLEVKHLKQPMIAIINDLFHFTTEGAYVKIAKIVMDTSFKQSTRTYLEMLTSMPRDGNNCVLQIAELVCPEQAILPKEIIELISNSECCQVKVLKYGNVTVLPQSCTYVNTNSCLVIDHELEASDALISLVKTGMWDEVRTREFNISLYFEPLEIPEVNRGVTNIVERRIESISVARDHAKARRHEAYDQIAPFMIKLGCTKLEFGDMTLEAVYNHKEVNQISLAQTLNGVMSGDQYISIAKSLFERSNATRVQIETITLQRDNMDHIMVTDEWDFKVRYLDINRLPILDYLQTNIKPPPINIAHCSLELNGNSVLQKLASGIHQIDSLDLVADNADDFKYLEQFVGSLRCLRISLTVGSANILIHKNKMQDITIRDITVDEFGSLYEATSPLLRKLSLLRVDTLRATPGSHEYCKELFKMFSDNAINTKAIKLQVRVFAVGESIVDCLQLRLDNESLYLTVDEMKTDDGIKVTFKHNRNNTIEEIQMNHLSVEYIFDINIALSGIEIAKRNLRCHVKHCTINANSCLELKTIAERLKKFSTDNTLNCQIKTLRLRKFFPEVFREFSDLLHAGKIQILMIEDEYTFRTEQHSNKRNVRMHGEIDKMTAKTLYTFMSSLGAYAPTTMLLKQCEVGTSWSDMSNRITGPNDEFKTKMLEVTRDMQRKETKEQLDALKAILNSNKNFVIEKLIINGKAGDVEAAATDIIARDGDRGCSGQVKAIQLESVSLESQSFLCKILNSGVGLEANYLFVNRPKERLEDFTGTLNLISNSNFKVSSIETKTSMQEVIQTICDLYPIVNPEKICSKDSEWKIIDHPQKKKEKLLVAIEGNVRSESICKFTGSFKMEVVTNENRVKYNNITGQKVPEVSYDDVATSRSATSRPASSTKRKLTRSRRSAKLPPIDQPPELPSRGYLDHETHPSGEFTSDDTQSTYCDIGDDGVTHVEEEESTYSMIYV